MSVHWTQRREGGGHFALWLIRTIGLRLGRPTARLLLYPITLYFFFRRGHERRMSYACLRRILERRANVWMVLRHIHCYAATILDRVFLLARSTHGFDVRVHGLDGLDTYIAKGKGALMLSAHIGSFEALRALADERPDLSVRIVMDRQQTPALTELLHALNPAIAASVIDVGSDGVASALAIGEAANQGALIGLLADRARPQEPTCDAMFCGSPAAFPIAPYLIASTLKLPIILSFGLYRGGNRYDLYFETFADCIQIPRHQREAMLREWTQRFATRLEHYTRLAPYNWFNFYDFWNHPAVVHAVVDQPAADAAA